MPKGLILVNAYYHTPEIGYQPARMQEELAKRGVPADILPTDGFPARVAGGRLRAACSGYDFCVYLDKDRYILRALELAGMPVFNGYETVTVCDDKMLTALALAKAGVPQPDTLPGPLCYRSEAALGKDTYARMARLLGEPFVVKESFSSLGAGVHLVGGEGEFAALWEQIKLRPWLAQAYVAESRGRDVRVIVVGGRALGGMLRQSGGTDFRSNVAAGGSAAAFPPDDALRTLAERAAAAVGAAFCGVDVLFGKDGYLVCEVNSNAYYGAFERATGQNVAGAYADYILHSLCGRAAQ